MPFSKKEKENTNATISISQFEAETIVSNDTTIAASNPIATNDKPRP